MSNGEAAEPIIRIEGLDKWFGHFQVLTDINLSVRPGERIVICGPSGSGKSTLIRCINRLETAQKGHIVVDGVDLGAGRKNVDAVRREVGMVFQQFNLFPHLTALQNCTLAPMRSRGMTKEEAEATAVKYLTRVRIPEQAGKYPSQLSGGQQQRVAIARALANDPTVILADEPTGALDSRTSLEIMALLQRLNREGMTIVVVTHEPDVAAHAGRILTFRDGRVVRDEKIAAPRDAMAEVAELPRDDEHEAEEALA
jgi:polar amino acid transport system ATP-binding protein